MRGWRGGRRWVGVVLGALALVVGSTGAANASPAEPDVGADTLGLYLLNSRNTVDPEATRGWEIQWEVPELTNPDEARGAIGQWYFNLESGIYRTADNGWAVYYFGDDNGLEENPPECSDTWDTGGICTGAPLNQLEPGQQVGFKYEWCDADHSANVDGEQICVYADMHDDEGWRFLAADARSTVEIYAHDVETFGDSDQPEPIISCDRPTRMLGQKLWNPDGNWTSLTGADAWKFEDESPSYQYQNTDTDADPATWESCSE